MMKQSRDYKLEELPKTTGATYNNTYVLWLRSHTSTAPSLTQANTVETRGDQHTSGTAFWI